MIHTIMKTYVISSTPGDNDYSQRNMPGIGSSIENEPLHERAFNQG
jgi:hypothetical protein